jgi:hypothetical protein
MGKTYRNHPKIDDRVCDDKKSFGFTKDFKPISSIKYDTMTADIYKYTNQEYCNYPAFPNDKLYNINLKLGEDIETCQRQFRKSKKQFKFSGCHCYGCDGGEQRMWKLKGMFDGRKSAMKGKGLKKERFNIEKNITS